MSKSIDSHKRGVDGGVSANDNPRKSDYTPPSFIELIISGDPATYDRLVKERNRALKEFLFKILRSREDAEEITQDVFIYIWQNRSRISPQWSLDGLIFSIARRRAIDRVRERARISVLLQDRYSRAARYADSPEDIAELNEARSMLDDTVAAMPDMMRRIYDMKFVKGLATCQIASELSIAASTVRTQIERAVRRINDTFDADA